MLRKADVGDRLGAEVEPSELGRIAELISCSAFKLYIKKQFPLLWGGRESPPSIYNLNARQLSLADDRALAVFSQSRTYF